LRTFADLFEPLCMAKKTPPATIADPISPLSQAATAEVELTAAATTNHYTPSQHNPAVDTPFIEVYGAREHNLKNVSVQIPRGKLVVFTGISGSGKSSLAFDTIYAEGQRRYMETFSAYARSFMGGLERPDVDKIEGLSPVISI